MTSTATIVDSPIEDEKYASRLNAHQAIPPISFAIVIPVYNHAESVGAVVREVLHLLPDLRVFVINDGSTDGAGPLLDDLARQINGTFNGDNARLTIIHHAANCGKGAALLTGFQAAAACSSHAVTIDSDGQHRANDIFRLLDIARMFPDDLIIGDRQMDFCAVPVSSKRGRDMSRFWFWIITGQDVPDSQCGLRVYPLAHTLQLPCIYKRFDFETEMLIRHAWAGLCIRSAPITCIYFPAEQRITHFRPFLDSVRGVRLYVLLTTWRIIYPFSNRRCRPQLSDIAPVGPSHGLFKPEVWRRAISNLFLSNLRDAQIAAAVGVGILIGFTPVWGFQTLLAFYVARRIHLNPIITMLCAQISTPPLMALTMASSITMGELLLHARLPELPSVPMLDWTWRWGFHNFALSLVVGGLVCGLLAGSAVLLITRGIISAYHAREAIPEPSAV
jgi:glycosyltransferase involved in cell wall biosynthesis